MSQVQMVVQILMLPHLGQPPLLYLKQTLLPPLPLKHLLPFRGLVIMMSVLGSKLSIYFSMEFMIRLSLPNSACLAEQRAKAEGNG